MRNTSSRKRLTYQDLLEIPEDRLRHELIDGKHLMSPAPIPRHQEVVMNLASRIFAYLQDHPIGRVYGNPIDVVLSNFDVVEPDVVYVSHERCDRYLTERCLAGPPELVVEVLSPGTARIDTGRKLRLYDRYGVDEYWIVDPVKEILRVYRRAAGRFRLAVALIHGKGGEDQALAAENAASLPAVSTILSTPLLPGLQITLDQLFA
jgi:Uma2 family endonuclease